MAAPTPETLGRLAADLSEGRVGVPVSPAYALDEVPAAFSALAGGTLGKLAVTIG